MRLIATALIIGFVAGQRTEFAPGDELDPKALGWSKRDIDELLETGALKDTDAEAAAAKKAAADQKAAQADFQAERAKQLADRAALAPPDAAPNPEPGKPAKK